jgi:hypothetical protein
LLGKPTIRLMTMALRRELTVQVLVAISISLRVSPAWAFRI